MKGKRRLIPVRAVLLCLAIHASVPARWIAVSGPSPGIDFLKEKSAGNYAEALDALDRSSLSPGSPVSIEVNVFRVRELMRYAELHRRGLEVLDRLAAAAGPQNPFIADRIDHIRTRLYLGGGDVKKAEAVQGSLCFLDFQVMGPFKNRGVNDFDQVHPPELGFTSRQSCGGTYGPVTWFPVYPDRTGIISFNDLYPDAADSLFYLARAITVPRTGEYYLIFGKTGYFDLWLDGKKIYSGRSRHGFCHDQYFIRAHLQAGPHRILIKAGGSHEGFQVSFRISGIDGRRMAVGPMDRGGPAVPSQPRGVAYFPALEESLALQDPGPDGLFYSGYLLFSAGLEAGENGRGMQLLGTIPESSPLYSSSWFYAAMGQEEAEARDRYLNRSIKADPRSIEALGELAALKIGHGYLYEAYPLIDAIKKISPRSLWHHDLTARLFIALGWHPEAMRHAVALKQTPYRSLGLAREAALLAAEADYAGAVSKLEELVRVDSFNPSWHRLLLDCYDHGGRRDRAEQLLLSLVALYPNDSSLKLRLARVVEMGRGPLQAVPFLTAALKAAPGNRDVLRELGLAFHKIGKKELAVHYLGLACRSDPGNRKLRNYLETIRGGGDASQ